MEDIFAVLPSTDELMTMTKKTNKTKSPAKKAKKTETETEAEPDAIAEPKRDAEMAAPATPEPKHDVETAAPMTLDLITEEQALAYVTNPRTLAHVRARLNNEPIDTETMTKKLSPLAKAVHEYILYTRSLATSAATNKGLITSVAKGLLAKILLMRSDATASSRASPKREPKELNEEQATALLNKTLASAHRTGRATQACQFLESVMPRLNVSDGFLDTMMPIRMAILKASERQKDLKLAQEAFENAIKAMPTGAKMNDDGEIEATHEPIEKKKRTKRSRTEDTEAGEADATDDGDDESFDETESEIDA